MYFVRARSDSPFTTIQGRLLLLIMMSVLSLTAVISTRFSAAPPAVPAPDTRLDFSELPLPFVANEGQSNPLVHFQVHDGGGTVFFTADEVVVALPSANAATSSSVRLHFEGANPAATLSGLNQLPGIVNYLIGDDPAGWHTAVPVYSGILYQELYPGIDLHYDGTTGRLKGTYFVAPGADPGQIRWRHDGATGVRVDRLTGNLVITLSGSDQSEATLIEQAPVAWQNVNGQHISVPVQYALIDGGRVGFTLGNYDPAYPLTIDPTLIYSTYLGGNGRDDGEGIAVDSQGNAYVVGSTSSTNFPTENSEQSNNGGEDDVFVTKINPAGNALVYSTYLGGSENDHGNDIKLDSEGNAYLAGVTYSGNFPTQNAYQGNCKLLAGICIGDAFVAKLNHNGSSLLYSTYLGGDSIDIAEGIAVDDLGSAYVTGFTASSNFPTKDALYGANDSTNAFVTKLNTSGNGLVYSTYLGGSDTDLGLEIAVDSGRNAYVTGETTSSNFPVQNPLQPDIAGGGDVFVAKLNAAGSALLYSTYLGGSDDDKVTGIAVRDGSAYITGQTESHNFPTHNPLQAAHGGGTFDAFVAKFAPAGNALDYSTYLGGSSNDWGNDLAVDSSGNAYVTGQTLSGNFPLANPLQSVHGGNGDVFVAKLGAGGGVLLYSTYLGGSHSDLGDGIDVDNEGNAFVTGITYSTNFPTQDPLWGSYRGGDFDAFIVKISDSGDQTLPPPPSSGQNLAGSHKAASRVVLGPNEELTYTIRLHNSGTDDAVVDVTDEVPSQLDFAGSITGGGTYNSSTKTITWSGITVAAGDEVVLSFKAKARANQAPAVVVNTAVIDPEGAAAFERSFPIFLVSHPVKEDVSPPVVNSVTIDEQDVLTDPAVTLHISATDNKAVTRMFVKEWELASAPVPHWKQVKSSGWVPFQENYPWSLTSNSGTHYVGVWVADAEGNVSHLTRDAIDFASLLLPGESIGNGDLVPYLVYYNAGVNVTATLATNSGDADLYVWFPGSYGKPDRKSISPDTGLDEVTFTTPTAGKYLFLVHGFKASTYDLSITPGGGPRVEVVAAGSEPGAVVQLADAATTSAKTDPPMILVWSGLDPLGVAVAPGGSFTLYLPVVFNN